MDVYMEGHDDCLCHMSPINMITTIKGSGVNCVTVSVENIVRHERLRIKIIGPKILVNHNKLLARNLDSQTIDDHLSIELNRKDVFQDKDAQKLY